MASVAFLQDIHQLVGDRRYYQIAESFASNPLI